MSHGGARPGAGRKAGTITRTTAEAIEKAQEGGELPLDYLLRVMRDMSQDDSKRIDCAKAAAPYLHARLNSIEAKIDADVAINTLTHRIIDGRATD